MRTLLFGKCVFLGMSSSQKSESFNAFIKQYKTEKKYDLVFGAILGMNHHDETIVFGCCFLSNEAFEAFEWLFKTWLEAMPMGPLISIVTYQDPVITKVVASVMPNARHRFCIWHIKNKLTKKLGGIAIHSNDFRTSFKKAVESVRTKQFESEWNK